MRHASLFGLVALAGVLLVGPAAGAAGPGVHIVTLGDSITRGVRPGVKADETFAARLQAALRREGIPAEVRNVGVGGERTDQALRRLAKEVLALRPAVVTVMYGTNDSYADPGRTDSRLPPDEYGRNLRRLVTELREAGVKPVLMTPPRWGPGAGRDGAGDHPNVRLARHVAVCRRVAEETHTPLVDHFAHWSKQQAAGVDVDAWMTDHCHPNPRGHEEIARLLLPVVRDVLKKAK